MNEEEVMARFQALTQLLNELRAILRALDQRLTTAEQSLQGKWF